METHKEQKTPEADLLRKLDTSLAWLAWFALAWLGLACFSAWILTLFVGFLWLFRWILTLSNGLFGISQDT